MNFPIDFMPRTDDAHHIKSGSFWVDDEIVFIFAYSGVVHDLNEAKLGHKMIVDMIPGKKLSMICDTRVSKIIEKDVRDFYASEPIAKNCLKFAFIVSFPFSKVVANFFARLRKKDSQFKCLIVLRKRLNGVNLMRVKQACLFKPIFLLSFFICF